MRDVFSPGVMIRCYPEPRLCRLAILIMLLCGAATGPAQADDYFNPALLGLGSSGAGSDKTRPVTGTASRTGSTRPRWPASPAANSCRAYIRWR